MTRKPVALDDAALDGVAGGWGVFAGGNGADNLRGGDTDEALLGFGGDDTLGGGGGHDTVTAGEGNDLVFWGPGEGNDSIDGEAGHDRLQIGSATAAEMVVTLSDGTRLAAGYDAQGNWGYALPPGASGTVQVGGETITFKNLEFIAGLDISRMMDDG